MSEASRCIRHRDEEVRKAIAARLLAVPGLARYNAGRPGWTGMCTGEVWTTCTNTHAYRVIETLVVTSCKRF